MSLDLFDDKISDYGVIQKVCHSKNRLGKGGGQNHDKV